MCSHERGKERPVLMLQAAFKRPSVHSDHHHTPRQSLDWDRVKPEDKTLVHQVCFINCDIFYYWFLKPVALHSESKRHVATITIIIS